MNASPNEFRVFEDHTSAQTNNQLVAAPTIAGRTIYVTDLIVSNGATEGTIKLVEDPGGSPVQISQTIYVGTTGGAVINFRAPIKLTANKALGFTSTGCTTHSIQVNGFYEP